MIGGRIGMRTENSVSLTEICIYSLFKNVLSQWFLLKKYVYSQIIQRLLLDNLPNSSSR